MNANITHALRSLGTFANGIIPSRIAGPEPDMQDAYEFQKDLRLLAAKVDAVIEAYGEYLESYGVLSQSDVKECFKDQLLGAIDGNALYLIEEGTRERIEYVRDEAAEHAAELRREAV